MIKTDKTCSIGIDIGGTKITGILFDGKKILASYTLATPRDNFEHFFIMLLSVIEPLLDKGKKENRKIKGIGLGIPGLVNKAGGKVIRARNVPYLDNINIVERLKTKIHLPIFIDNDASCFLIAEAKIGAGKKNDNIYGLTIGTGIGGGWWLNGKIYEGTYGAKGEICNTIVDYNEGTDLEDFYHKLMQNNPAQVADEAYAGDILAEKSYEEFGRYLGISLSNIINLLNPEAIIIGGSVIESGDLFLSTVRNTIDLYVKPPAAKKIKILKSSLGQEAGAIGAALLV